MKKVLFFCLSSFIVLLSAANDDFLHSNENAFVQSLLFKRFFTYNGLPDERIRSIFQDKKGFLWIGTMNGICRYDGYLFKNYFGTDSRQSIAGNWNYAITEDNQYNIWVATNEGFSKFDQTKEVFTNFSLPVMNGNALAAKRVNTLLWSPTQQLWLGTKNGLYVYNINTNQYQKIAVPALCAPVSKIIASANANHLWIATDASIVDYNIKTGVYKVYPLQVRPSPYGDKVWSIVEYQRDVYVATAADGLLKLSYNPATHMYSQPVAFNQFEGSKESLENTQVFDMRVAQNGDLWLGTVKGLAKIKKTAKGFTGLEFFRNNTVNNKSISSDRVYALFIDKTNVLWCGTELGLNKLDLNSLPFHYYTFNNQRLTDQVRGIHTHNGVDLLVATFKSGFHKFNLLTKQAEAFSFVPEPSFYNASRSVYAMPDGKILVGTLNGLLQINNNGYTPMLGSHAVFAILRDQNNNQWIGTNIGLFKIDASGKMFNVTQNTASPSNITSPFVRTLFQDSNGNIWVGFENGGLGYIDVTSNQLVMCVYQQQNKPIIGNTVYAVAEYPKNTLWVGSERGMTKIVFSTSKPNINKATITQYSEQDGLPDKSVNGILSDDAGNLWISSIKGLARFNCQKGSFQNFLPNIYFTHSCCFKYNKHQLFFGTADGFLTFDPAQIVSDTALPALTIADFKLFNKTIHIGDEVNGSVVLNNAMAFSKSLALNYKNNVFTIDFAALHFANPEYNKFAYKMEGFDKDWIFTNVANRSATYTNLDPGTYTFKLKAANYLGVWNNVPHELTIKILPPPWKTWWAYAIYLLILGAGMYVLSRYSIMQLKQRQQLRYEQIEKAQLKKLDELKTHFFTDISHEFRTPLSLIVGPTQELLESDNLSLEEKNKMSLIQRNSKKLLYLIDELMTFQKLDQGKLQLKPETIEMVAFVYGVYQNFQYLAKQKKIFFDYLPQKDSYFVHADLGKMEMVLNNLLFNAFKYVPSQGTIRITLQHCTTAQLPSEPVISNTDWLCVAVEDNGKGINEADFEHLFERYFQSNNSVKGTGVGLSLTKNLVELHKGIITASSHPGVKTSFAFYLPLLSEKELAEAQAVPKNYLPEYNLTDLSGGALSSIDSQEEATEQDKPILLLVDDNTEILDYLDMIFKQQYHIDKVGNGVEALHYLQNNEPDLIISDVMMPEMDGITFCKKMKSNIQTSHVPIILLTAKSTVDSMVDGLQIGADDYIAKPFYPEVLKAKVANFIENRRRLSDKLIKTSTENGGVIIPKDITKNPLDEAFLKNVMDAILANLDNEEFSVEELGNIVAMSRSNLFRKLKAVTGQTPNEFLYFVRLNKAMEMLLERKMSISQISYEVGFKSASSFTKSFKKQFGKAPSDYLNDMIHHQLEDQKNRQTGA